MGTFRPHAAWVNNVVFKIIITVITTDVDFELMSDRCPTGARQISDRCLTMSDRCPTDIRRVSDRYPTRV